MPLPLPSEQPPLTAPPEMSLRRKEIRNKKKKKEQKSSTWDDFLSCNRQVGKALAPIVTTGGPGHTETLYSRGGRSIKPAAGASLVPNTNTKNKNNMKSCIHTERAENNKSKSAAYKSNTSTEAYLYFITITIGGFY